MKQNVYSPENILSALNSVEEQLIPLVGKEWSKITIRYNELKHDLSVENAKHLASMELIDLFLPYKAARELLNTAIIREDEFGDVMLTVADIMRNISLEHKIIKDFTEAIQPSSKMRHIFLKEIDEAKSVKLGNIDFDFGGKDMLLTAIMTTIADRFVWNNLGPFFIAVGILAIAQKLIEGMTVKFDENEATVFYGFCQIVSNDKTALENDILQATNLARNEIGLIPLDKNELKNALHKLQKLQTIELIDRKNCTWRIKESYRLKNKLER